MSHAFILPSLPPHAVLPLLAGLATGLFVLCLVLAVRGAVSGRAQAEHAAHESGGRVRDPRVSKLARKGYTPLAIATRTGLPQDAVRALLAATGVAGGPGKTAPRVPATRKFVPDLPAASLVLADGPAGDPPAQRTFASRLNAALSRASAPGTRLA